MRKIFLVAANSSADWRLLDPGASHFASVDAQDFGVIEERSKFLLQHAISRHLNERWPSSRLTLIVCPAQPPLENRRKDPPICSFLASRDLLHLVSSAAALPGTWCFKLLRHALAQSRVNIGLQIVHNTTESTIPKIGRSCETILSHRGPERYLRLCVDSLLNQSHATAISIGIDQKYPCNEFLEEIKHRAGIQVFQLFPHPVGPFVSLHVLGHRSPAEFIVRQDSDDVSLRDRLALLVDVSLRDDAGIVGSHELQLNELTQQVIPVRFPLDVNAALRQSDADHQMLLPTTIVRRDAFRRIGGFSTDRIFGLDVNFWLLASLVTRLVNVDEFLYVRRRHARSLTMRQDIGTGSPIRKSIKAQLARDYAAITAGRLKVQESALALRHRPDLVQFRNVRTGDRAFVDLRAMEADTQQKALSC